jgi:hypothetical protein
MGPSGHGQRTNPWAWRLGVLVAGAATVAVCVGLAWAPRARGMAFSARQRLKRPQLLSLQYGRFRPQGAPHRYFALKLRVRVHGGQVVQTDFYDRPSGFSAVGDSECGIGGRKNNGVETFFMPVMPRFARGVHRVHVTAIASSCNTNSATAGASRTFRLSIR